jgi:hypothetical protein
VNALARARANLAAAEAKLNRMRHDYLVTAGWRYAKDGEVWGWCRPGKSGPVMAVTDAIREQDAKEAPPRKRRSAWIE